MNPLNYATLEAGQRLHAKGIELRTDFYWHLVPDKDPELLFEAFAGMLDCPPECKLIPAPSMAEVWRELPNRTEIFKEDGENEGLFSNGRTIGRTRDANPTDALIDLLIWVKGNKK
jgi:hypothetical protein